MQDKTLQAYQHTKRALHELADAETKSDPKEANLLRAKAHRILAGVMDLLIALQVERGQAQPEQNN